MSMHEKAPYCSDFFTDFLCVCSILGIWPRFIEPRLLSKTTLELEFENLPKDFDGFTLVHLSDLHLSSKLTDSLLQKVQKELEDFKPDLIIFTGDFICHSKIEQKKRLLQTLQKWRSVAPVLACAGNHDYERYVTQRSGLAKVNSKPRPFLLRALGRLFFEREIPSPQSYLPQNLNLLPELQKIIKDADIQLLHNQAHRLSKGASELFVIGLEDLWTRGGAFINFNKDFSKQMQDLKDKNSLTLVLCHNPDMIELLQKFPPSLVLSGHTHGGNISLPWVLGRIKTVKNEKRLRGLSHENNHLLYVNRGLCSPYPLRLFSTPEITKIFLRTKASKSNSPSWCSSE